MLNEIDAVARFLEFGGDHRLGIHRGDTESDEGRGHLQIFEGTAHGVLAADGGKP